MGLIRKLNDYPNVRRENFIYCTFNINTWLHWWAHVGYYSYMINISDNLSLSAQL